MKKIINNLKIVFLASLLIMQAGWFYLCLNSEKAQASQSTDTKVNLAVVTGISTMKSSVTAIPSSVPSDGATASTIIVTIKDPENRPIENIPVRIASNRGNIDLINEVRNITSLDGVALFTIASTKPGPSSITAWAVETKLDQQATVLFTLPSVTNVNLNLPPSIKLFIAVWLLIKIFEAIYKMRREENLEERWPYPVDNFPRRQL